MKKMLLILLVMAGIASCKNDSGGSPTATIDGMFNAMKSGNLEEMKKFITKSDLSFIEAVEKGFSAVDSAGVGKLKEKISGELREKLKTITYTLKNEKIDGDNATIEAEVSENGKKDSHTFELVREDDGWKIALSKPGNEMFNSMKGNMGRDKGDMNQGLERLKNMNPDSLKMLINKASEAIDSMHNKSKTN